MAKIRKTARQNERIVGFAETSADEICRRTLVIIPALNEAKTLPAVLSSLKYWPLAGIRVVDNGSTDDTEKLATRHGAEVLREPVRGYGSACWRGMRDLPADIEWVLFCDADGSDDLGALLSFFEAAAEGSDFVLGNRNSLPESRRCLSLPQRFGNALAGRLIDLRWGMRFLDLGPLRLIRRSCLERLKMEDRGFGWTVEMQAKAAAMKLATVELPVSYFARKGGTSKISGTVSGTLKAGSVILCTLAKLWMRKDRPHD